MKDLFQIGSDAVSVGSKVYTATIYKHEDDITIVDEASKEGLKPINAAPSKVITKPEKWVKDNGTLGKIADAFFSPNMSRVFALVSMVLLFFSPLGIIFGAIAAAIAGAMFVYEIARDINKLRSLKELQEKRAIFEEIHSIELQLKQICARYPQLAKLNQIIHNIDQDTTIAGKSTTRKILVPIMERIPDSAVGITASALTLNPIALGASTLNAIFGTWGNYAQKNAYWQKKEQLINHLNSINIKLDRNANIASLRLKLEARQHQLEIFQTLEKECQRMQELDELYKTHPEKFRQAPPQEQELYNQYKQNPDTFVGGRYQFLISDHHHELQRKFQYPSNTSYLRDVATLFRAGNTWSSYSRLFTPMLNNYGQYYHSPSTVALLNSEYELEQQKAKTKAKTEHRITTHDKGSKKSPQQSQEPIEQHQRKPAPVILAKQDDSPKPKKRTADPLTKTHKHKLKAKHHSKRSRHPKSHSGLKPVKGNYDTKSNHDLHL